MLKGVIEGKTENTYLV